MRSRTFIAFAILAVALPSLRAAPVSPISIRVEQVVSNDSDKSRHTQKRALKVLLTNGSSDDVNNLKVKYFHFGRGLKDHDASVIAKGECSASIKAHATETVETPSATSTYTEEHAEREGGGKNNFNRQNGRNRNGQNIKYKTVEASGTKLTGYAVQVYSGAEMVAEYYSEPSLKAQLH